FCSSSHVGRPNNDGRFSHKSTRPCTKYTWARLKHLGQKSTLPRNGSLWTQSSHSSNPTSVSELAGANTAADWYICSIHIFGSSQSSSGSEQDQGATSSHLKQCCSCDFWNFRIPDSQTIWSVGERFAIALPLGSKYPLSTMSYA